MFGISAISQVPFSTLALTGQIQEGVASVNANATLTADANRIQFSSGSISSTATLTAIAVSYTHLRAHETLS
jgi:hypothetical protein